MNRNLERRRDFVGSICFIALILVLIIGGYFATKYLTSDSQKKQIQKSASNKIKVDSSKDFVYYENEESLSDDPDINYKDIVINIKNTDTLNEVLKKENDEIRKSLKKISESEKDPSREILYEKGDVFYTKERNYAVIESAKYLSILITDGEFSCYTGSTINRVKTYNFSLSSGKQISNETLLGYNNMTIDDAKQKVREKLVSDQADFGEENTIDIDNTLNSINLENASLYVNHSGKLLISVIVKTNQESYNDSIELN